MTRPPGYRDDPHAGSLPGAMRAPPGKVPSPRNGRMVAPSTALLEYGQDFNSIPVRSEGLKGGMFDYEQDTPRRGPPRKQREDATDMERFFNARGNTLTTREWELYKLFWEHRYSYAEISRSRGDVTRDGVYRAICRLRVKCKQWCRVSL